MTIEHLVLLDMDQIKSFIFAAPYLKEIRGSSRILSQLNDPEDPREIDERVKAFDGELLYAGGGSVLAKFPSKTKAKEFIDNEKHVVEERTRGGARFSSVFQPIADEGFGKAIRDSQAKLADAKSRRHFATRNPQSNLFKSCQSCGYSSAQVFNEKVEKLVCSSCNERILQSANTGRLYSRFSELLALQNQTVWQDAQFADDLKTLAATSNNYIGVIRADGNAMGERIRLLAEIGDKNLFKSFSDECRKATEGAVLKALRNAYLRPRESKDEKIFPFEFVLLGGDDVEIITTADQAIQIAIDFCDEFTSCMSQFAQNCGNSKLAVAMSAGVAIAHSNYPISSLDEVAEQLLKSAKTRSRKDSPDPPSSIVPTIDFMIVTSSMSGSLETVRGKEYRQNKLHRLTQRPYSTAELNTLLVAIRDMRYPDGQATAFPRSKLQDLYKIFFPFRNKAQAMLDFLMLQRRLSNQGDMSHREMLRKLTASTGETGISPWREVNKPDLQSDTCIVDMVEIYDFVSKL